MGEDRSHQAISLPHVDAVLAQSLSPFSDTRIKNRIRFRLNRTEALHRVTHAVTARSSKPLAAPLPSLQLQARETETGIIVEYELLPQRVTERTVLEEPYALAQLQAFTRDAIQFFFMAMNRALHDDDEQEEQHPAQPSETEEDEKPVEEAGHQEEEPTVQPESELEELDLFEYHNYQDNSVKRPESIEPLQIEL